ncbi:hypothetical protein GWK18_10970 [Kocuria sp. JC486]|uniref:hypothetical protein n=1 Tax=Kocuria soli TaxID=2485125 RepID=UPI000F4DAD1E|nr:hypothetical protein [Kocuria soli]NHU86096.1 hypothetical protein [Kocuria sp. JC486]
MPSFLGALPESIRRGAALDELHQDLLILEANPCGRWTGAVYVIDEENPGYRKTQDLDLLRILGSHPGAWSLEAAKFLALGMSATSPQARTVPAEIMVDVVGRRISALGMGAGFSQVVAKVKITRWIGALTEAAQNSAEGSLTGDIRPDVSAAQAGT